MSGAKKYDFSSFEDYIQENKPKDGESQKQYDFSSFDETLKKKEDGGTAGVSPSPSPLPSKLPSEEEKQIQKEKAILTKAPEYGKLPEAVKPVPKPSDKQFQIGEYLDPKLFNKATAASTYVARPRTEQTIKQVETSRKNKQEAIDVTTERALKNKGIKADRNSPAYLAQRKKIERAVNEGDAVVTKNPITGAPELSQTTGFLESMWNGVKAATNDEEEAREFVNNMTTEQRIEYANRMMGAMVPTEEGYAGKVPSPIAGKFGETIGAAVPFITKATAGAVAGAGLVALAPETGGASLAGLPAVMSFAFTTPDMVNQGGRDEVIRRYQILKRDYPSKSDIELMQEAEKGLVTGEIAGGLTNLAFTTIGGSPIKGKNTLKNFMKGTARSAVHMGTIITGVETGKEIAVGAKDEKYRLKATELIDNAVNSFVDNATVGGLLHATMNAPKLPGALHSAIKYSLSKENISEIAALLKGNEIIGNIPEGSSDIILRDLNDYKLALDKTSENLSPDTQASVAGLIQKRDKLMTELALKDPTQIESYQKEIDAINEQIKKITETNDPFAFEVNDITGEKLEAEVSAEPEIKEGEQVYRVEYYDPETKQMTHKLFPDEQAGTAFENKLTDAERAFGTKGYFERYDGRGIIEEAVAEVPVTEEKIKTYDKEDITGVPSEVGVGEKPIEAEPVIEAGKEEAPTAGILQAPRIEGEVKVAEEAVEAKKSLGQELIGIVWDRLAKQGVTNADSIIGTRETIDNVDFDKFWSNVTKEDLQNLKKQYETKKKEQLDLYDKFKGAFDPSTGTITSNDTSFFDNKIKIVDAELAALETKAAEPIAELPLQKAEGVKEVMPEATIAPKEGDAVTLPPQTKGGIERQMVFKDGEWKQKVGNYFASYSTNTQLQAQRAWEKMNMPKAVEVPKKEVPLTPEKETYGTTEAEGAPSEIKINSEKVQYNGTDAIGSRTRTESEQIASRNKAKEKIKNPETNASLKAANSYNKSVGLPEVTSHKYKPSDPVLQKEIADIYPKLKDVNSPEYKEIELERRIYSEYKNKYPEIFKEYDIKDYKDLVNKSYAQLIKETQLQYESLPVKLTFHEKGEGNYENNFEMLDDVHNFNHLWVYKGGEDHTALGSKTMDKNGLTANDKFRGVHDYFGHSVEGYQFGKDGEENAWIEHSKMFSPLAQWALTSETRGQNSWVNYSGVNNTVLEAIKTGSALKREGKKLGNQEMINEGEKLLSTVYDDFQFAEQKAIILPEKYTDISKYHDQKIESTPEKLKVKETEVSKSLADKIRSLKIDLGKGAAQSNIAGVPIALYNTAVEAIALSVEAGTAINKAISDAIKKYKLEKEKEFDKDVFASNILKSVKITEPEKSPIYFENLKKFASESSFPNKLEFKRAIQNQAKEYNVELKKKYGKDFDPSVYDNRTKQYLTDITTKEALDAVTKHPEAIGWYDEKTQSALDVISAIHPEVAKDTEARGAFILPLAVMSNGNKVDFNFELAEKQYKYYKENKRFNPEGEFGLQQSGIKKSLELINSLLDNGLTMGEISKFLTSKYEAKDLKVRLNNKVKNLASGELANEQVYGAVVLGPKIGNGFYMNLWGAFDQLTMDRWFMRTWGRMTGTLIQKDPALIKENQIRVTDALSAVKADKDAFAILKSVLPKTSGLSIQEISKGIQKISADKSLRKLLSSNEKTDELRKSSISFVQKLSGEKEAPASGTERRFIREVYADVLNNLKTKHGIDISMADLQAALWYPEKILYESFKEGETFEGAAEGYTLDSAPDYFNAAKKLANKLGINETAINEAVSRGREQRAGRVPGEGYAEPGKGVSESYQDAITKFKKAIGDEPAPEKVKKVTNAVRSLKIKQEGLQANIAGIPIAMYNAALETIALGIEAGATITQAINKAIREHGLDKEKEFNYKEFVDKITGTTGESVDVKSVKRALKGIPEDIKGITMEDNAQRRKDLGMPERQPTVRTDAEVREKASKMLEEGYDVDALLSKMEKGQATTDVESEILSIYGSTIDKALRENMSDENIARAKRFITAREISSTEMGRGFRALQKIGAPLENFTDFTVAKMEANGVDVLTEKQKADIKETYDKITKEKEKYEALYNEAQAKITELEAQKELNKKQKEVAKEGKKDYKAERESLKSKLKDVVNKYKQSINKLGITPEEGAERFAMTAEMAKIVMEIVASHVAETGAKLAEVTRKTYDDVKDLFDGITERDIHDVISGKYSEKKKPLSQLKKDIADIKSEAKILNEMERVMAGIPKTEKEKVEKNRKLTDLRKQLNELKKEYKADQYSDEARIKRTIEANKKKQAQIEKKIADKDFEPEEKPISVYDNPEFKAKYPELYKELLDSYNSKQDAMHEYEVELMKDAYSKLSKSEKIIDFGAKAINTTKKLVSGVDDSAVFMQTLVAMAVRPVIGGKAFARHLVDAASKKAYERRLAELHNSPLYDLMQKSGLDITEPKSLSETKKEEAFAGESLDIEIKIKGKKTKVLGSLLAPFERAFTSLGNNMRAIAFAEISDKFIKEGHTFENNPKLFKDLATMLNTETGRGKQNEYIQRATKLVTAGIWSPRLMASRINVLGISDVVGLATGKKLGTKGYYSELDPRIRKQAIQDLAQFVAAVTVMSYAMAYTFGGEVDNDPTSQSFLDVKIGDKSYNLSGGFSQYVRLIAQTIAGGQTRDGKFKEFEGYKDRGSNALHFLRGKLNPLSQVLADLFVGTDYVGQPVTVQKEIPKLFIPLSMQDVANSMDKDGVSALLTSTLPSFVGIQVKDKREFQKNEVIDAKSTEYKFLEGKDVKIPRVKPANTYKIDSDKGEDGVMTESQYEQFKNKVTEYFNDGWEDENGKQHRGVNEILESDYKLSEYDVEGELIEEKEVKGKELDKEKIQNKLDDLFSKTVNKVLEEMKLRSPKGKTKVEEID